MKVKADNVKSNQVLLGVIGGVIALGVLLFVFQGLFTGLETIEPEQQYTLLPPDVELAKGKPGPIPSRQILGHIEPERSGPTATPKPTISETDRLTAITANWVYRGYIGVGDNQQGRFTRRLPGKWTTEAFYASLNEVIEGVKVDQLGIFAAVARLGNATISLPLVAERRYPPEEMKNPVIPSEEEAKAAQTAYSEEHKKRFELMAKKYTPRPGERMPPPKPPTEEENQIAMNNYLGTMVPKFQQMNAKRTPVPGAVVPLQHDNPFDE